MGLLVGLFKATLITSIIYFVYMFLKKKWLDKMSTEFQIKTTPYLFLTLIFVIEIMY